jgi:hypothetical protein
MLHEPLTVICGMSDGRTAGRRLLLVREPPNKHGQFPCMERVSQ